MGPDAPETGADERSGVAPWLQGMILVVSLVVIGIVLVATDQDVIGVLVMTAGGAAGAALGARLHERRRRR